MLRKTLVPALSISTMFVGHALAADWDYDVTGRSQTDILTGGYGAVGDTSGNIYEDSSGNFSYYVILDSGSSGFLMSNFVQTDLGVPLEPGVTYQETGIGGSETENVTQSTDAFFAPLNLDGNNPASFSNYGPFNFEARQQDIDVGGFTIFFDVIGTPIIKNYVMQVLPNNITDVIQETGVTNFAETHLLTSLPTNLPSHGVYHVPIKWENFVTTPNPAPSENENPVIENVMARAVGSNTDVSGTWLFDSGAQFSIVDPTYATKTLGIVTGSPAFQVVGQGVGSSTVTYDGYYLTDIALPLSNGDRLVFENPVVFIPEMNNLPAGFDGILGENLFEQATDNIDLSTGEEDPPIESPIFDQWYLDGPGNQLVLVDPNSAYQVPEPTSAMLLAVGGTGLLGRRPRRMRKDV